MNYANQILKIPILEFYRGVGIQDEQDHQRVMIVKSHIDLVYSMKSDLIRLWDFVTNRSNAPEARLLAKACLLAHVEEAAASHRSKPDINLEKLDAWTTSLDLLKYRSPEYYCSGLLPRPAPWSDPRNPVKRPHRLA